MRLLLVAALCLVVAGCSVGSAAAPRAAGVAHPAGVSVDLATALAEHLRRTLVIENIAFDGLIPALKTGKIDLILSSLTRTEERAQSIDFSDPYLETGLCLLVNASSGIVSASDLNQAGRKVAVKKGTTGHTYATTRLASAQILVLDQESAAVLEVAQGKADAFIYDPFSIFQHWKRHSETTRAILQPFQVERWAIGIRKGNTDLAASVNRFLKGFRENGGFERLGDRWFQEQKAEMKKLGLAFAF